MQPLQLLESTTISIAQLREEEMDRRSVRAYQAYLHGHWNGDNPYQAEAGGIMKNYQVPSIRIRI